MGEAYRGQVAARWWRARVRLGEWRRTVDGVVRAHHSKCASLLNCLLERGQVRGGEVVRTDLRVHRVPIEAPSRAPVALEGVCIEVFESNNCLNIPRVERRVLQPLCHGLTRVGVNAECNATVGDGDKRPVWLPRAVWWCGWSQDGWSRWPC